MAVPLSIALLVAWTVVLARGLAAEREVGGLDIGLLVAGVVSFLVIMGVLVTFAVFLAREILEVRRQDGFIDSVTHELKSPLASMKLCLQTLARPNLGEDKRRELRTMMLEDLDRLSTFIDDVVEAGRLADAAGGIRLEVVDVEAMIRETVRTVAARHHAPETCVRVEIDGPDGETPDAPAGAAPSSDSSDPPPASSLTVRTDRDALETVLRNLLDNALKYSGGDPEITVRAWLEGAGNQLVLEVADRGIGIQAKHVRRIFQRFYRAPGEEVRQRKGTGLGLFIVHALVRNLGGRVDARSPGEGEGTVFRVVLPRGKMA
ncbi:MAG TPA: HAMP domain-containing sensor histidine kinase [Polyangiaceae bacterium LLY-WYZ-14_1]|nr:HAMP domain-containing sensor histidine kinase [Polyangiaceae bacterium LLY-WYZ-14_1]